MRNGIIKSKKINLSMRIKVFSVKVDLAHSRNFRSTSNKSY